MAYIPATWIIELAMKYLLDSEEVRNIFHVDAHADPTVELMQDVIDVFETAWVAEVMPLLSNELTFYGVDATDLTAVDGESLVYTLAAPVVGGNVVDALPNNCALCVTWSTPKRGRSFRGRTYIPGLGDTYTNGSRITTTQAATWAGVFADLMDAIDGSGWDLVVTSRYADGAPRSSAVSTPINAVGVNTVMDSQRRRLPGRGQ